MTKPKRPAYEKTIVPIVYVIEKDGTVSIEAAEGYEERERQGKVVVQQ